MVTRTDLDKVHDAILEIRHPMIDYTDDHQENTKRALDWCFAKAHTAQTLLELVFAKWGEKD